MERWSENEMDPSSEPYAQPKVRMHPDDANNFLKLAAALKILLARTVRLEDLGRAENLLREYLEGYLVVSSCFLLLFNT